VADVADCPLQHLSVIVIDIIIIITFKAKMTCYEMVGLNVSVSWTENVQWQGLLLLQSGTDDDASMSIHSYQLPVLLDLG